MVTSTISINEQGLETHLHLESLVFFYRIQQLHHLNDDGWLDGGV
jgi:hypothetical protein